MNFKTDDNQRGQLVTLAGLNFLDKNGKFVALTIENGLLFAVHKKNGLSWFYIFFSKKLIYLLDNKPIKKERIVSQILPNQVYSLKINQKAGDSFISIKLDNRTVQIPVDNEIFTSVSSSAADYEKSSFFIGGYPPGITKSNNELFSTFSRVTNNSSLFFNGCFENVNIFIICYI